MKGTTRFLIILAALLVLGGAVGWAVYQPAPQITDRGAALASASTASGALDGMVFRSDLGPEGKPADVNDQLVFANGMFQSIECARRCGYPPSPYFVRRVGEAIEFVTESHCEHKNATMVWEGTVENGAVKGRIYWTAERWYWTVENEFWFEGTLENGSDVIGSRN